MFGLFTKKNALIDQATRDWIFDTFAWAIEHFDREMFWQHTQVILPNNHYYPGRVGSVEEMAANVFSHTLSHAGMSHWPVKLTSMAHFQPTQMPQLTVTNKLRGADGAAAIHLVEGQSPISIVYQTQQINQPQDMIAFYVQQLASVLVHQQKVLPPGGAELVPQAIEVLACVMGFGVMFANTAYQFKGGCGSCNNPHANRQAALPEYDSLYCLAVFSHLKAINNKQVVPHLKSHLRSVYKRMVKDVAQSLARSKDYPYLSVQ